MKHLNIKIHGKVQGVFFRVSTKEKADNLGLVGFVRNEADGTVYIEVEGEEGRINEFLEWCQEGSRNSQVDKVEFEKGEIKEFNDFSITG